MVETRFVRDAPHGAQSLNGRVLAGELQSKPQGMSHVLNLLVEPRRADKDGDSVLLRKDFWSPVEAFDELPVFADIGWDLVGGRLSRGDPGGAVNTYDIISFRVGIEVEAHLRVGLDVAHLLAGHRVDEEGLSVPPEPDRHRVRLPVPAARGEPDDVVPLEPRLRVLARHFQEFGGFGIVAK